jgi:hypothetical protein
VVLFADDTDILVMIKIKVHSKIEVNSDDTTDDMVINNEKTKAMFL